MLVAKEKKRSLLSVLYSLPNKVHYQINLKEHEELNRQVMTPCVVPTLLMPKEDGTCYIYVNSRTMNQIIIKLSSHIPRIDD